MWLKSIKIENIKGFREETILFHNKNNPYKWITLLGENGVGKSTLLQAIALLLAGSDGATHSPFVAAGAGDDALTLTVKMINGEVQIEAVENIAAYDVDYILRSPAFGLVSTHSPATQEKIDRYNYLTGNRNNLQGEQIEEYEKLRQFMKEFRPIGGKPEPGSLEDKINKFLEENL